MRVVFSRTGMVLLLILVQLLIFFLLPYYYGSKKEYIYSAYTVLSVLVIIWIMNREDNPAFKLTWILFVVVVPVAGSLAYILVDTQLKHNPIKRRLAKEKIDSDSCMEQDEDAVRALWASNASNSLLSYYLSTRLDFPTYRNTEATYYTVGEEFFPALIAELNKAKSFIFLEYFIIDQGYMWSVILKILRQKAKEGVEVRVMYDGMNSIQNLPHNYPKRLERYGIKCRIANPIAPFLSTVQNNRDHRKICVIDGNVAFTGGVNLADEYINRKKRFGKWKDTAIMLKGDAVSSFTVLFLQSWNTYGKAENEYAHYIRPKQTGFRRELGYMIPYADNPYDGESVGEEVYFHILNHAKHYVHIMTPYLILDHEMLRTLTRVAKSGIEVAIIMPHIPDKWYAFVLAQTYYEELIKSGVQIYEFEPGFVHAKVFVSDDNTATVGSVNLDYRSLYLHFECGVFIYNNSEIFRIEEDFQNTLKECHKVTLMEVRQRTLLTKIAGNLLRLVAPLM